MTFTTRPTLQGTFGMVSSTHWLASQSAHADARAGWQRLRRGGGRRLRAARRRAAPQRSRRRRAGDRRDGRGPDAARAVRSGPGPGRARPSSTSARSGLDHVPGSGPLAAAVPGAVDAWLLLLRDHGTRPLADVLEPAIGYAARRAPAAGAGGRHGRPGAGRCSASTGRPRPSCGCRAARRRRAGELFANPALRRTCCERLVDAGHGRRRRRAAQIDAARRGLAPGVRGRGGRRVPRRPFRDSSGEAARRAGDRRRTWPPSRPTWEEPATVRVARRRGRQDRAVGPGPGAAAGAGDARRARRPAALDPSTRRGHPRRRRGAEAAFADREAWYGDGGRRRRSTTLLAAGVRRASARRWSGTRAALERAPGPPGRARAAAARAYVQDQARRATAPARRRPPGEPTVRPGRGDPRRHLPHRRRRPLGQHHLGDPERRLAAELADRSPSWASASAAGCRCSGWTRGCRPRWRPGRRPRTTLTPDPGAARRRARCWPAARPAATSRTSGSCCSCCGTSSAGMDAAGGDRRADVPHDQLPGLVLPARDASRACSSSRTGSAATCSTRSGRGATTCVLAGAWTLGRMCAVSRDPRTGRARGRREPARHAGLRRRPLSRTGRGPSRAHSSAGVSSRWSRAAAPAACTWAAAAASAASASPASMASTRRMCSTQECGARWAAPIRKTQCTCR